MMKSKAVLATGEGIITSCETSRPKRLFFGVFEMNWISVDDRLPETGQQIIICVDKRVDPQAVFMHKVIHGEEAVIKPKVIWAIVRATGNDGDGNFIETERQYYSDPNHVTHWMPLPEPPESHE